MRSNVLIKNTSIPPKNKQKQSTKMYTPDKIVQKNKQTRIRSKILELSRNCYEKDSDDCESYWEYLSSIERNLNTFNIPSKQKWKQQDDSNGRWDVI